MGDLHSTLGLDFVAPRFPRGNCLQTSTNLQLGTQRYGVCPELYMRMEPGKDDGRRPVGAEIFGIFCQPSIHLFRFSFFTLCLPVTILL